MEGTNKVNYQNGVMPTNEWFEKIKAHVDFKSKSVVDFGCAEGVMCELSQKSGADFVTGIDLQQPTRVENGIIFVNRLIEDFEVEHIDIGIFSMIIHWIGKEQFLRVSKNIDEIIIIFRLPNDGYQIPFNGHWFPTLDELDEVLDGFRRTHTEELMEQDNGKKIRLAIYDRKKR